MEISKKKVASAVLNSILGTTTVVESSVKIGYDTMFSRYERPDYDLYPGQYCIERMPDLTREEFWIWSNKNRLKAYMYNAKNAKGLIVFAHGLHAGADEYLPIFKFMLNEGFSVLSYNVTGTYESEGESTVGMCQSLVDINNVIDFVQREPILKTLPLFTMGHSWGGYAASAVLNLKFGISACALIAPMRNGSTMMLEKAEQYVGKIAAPTAPLFNSYQDELFGDFVNYDAIGGINKSGIPVLVAQGIDDKVITFTGQSITAKIHEIKNPNVMYYFGKGLQGDHNNIWHSERAAAYQMRVESDLKLWSYQKGEALTNEDKKAYYRTINHELYSEVNYELMEKIVEMFNKASGHQIES